MKSSSPQSLCTDTQHALRLLVHAAEQMLEGKTALPQLYSGMMIGKDVLAKQKTEMKGL